MTRGPGITERILRGTWIGCHILDPIFLFFWIGWVKFGWSKKRREARRMHRLFMEDVRKRDGGAAA